MQEILKGKMELHKDPKLEHRHQRQTKKFDHLVFGPAAGEGLLDRLQCQGTKALNKTHFSFSLRNSKFGNGISFVTVFTTYNSTVDSLVKSSSNEQVSVGNKSYNKVFLEQKLEEQSQFPGQISHYIFTDSDVAVVDDLGQIFKDYLLFDLALTFRNNKEQPLNSGFIAVRGSQDGIRRWAKVFLQEVLQVYSSKYMKASRMLGDQLALAWVVKSHPSFNTKRFTRQQPFEEKIGGASVLFLPCATYNWTPPEGAGQFQGCHWMLKYSISIFS
ncbi:hypothetical protein AG4045_000100 [Apium graveolens]|uniref:Nucleotide-diphospho-sugar transferase domain-containing protein n=1 Tax=Apium graveolens TaxID=4045 RepID=A0A6L5B821_APIGR|nr:hypothetical protein AG4045_000097 [Apium graveolens]KAF1001733.1 hypothetical protein AG4045_000100 [Apium graveolens]